MTLRDRNWRQAARKMTEVPLWYRTLIFWAVFLGAMAAFAVGLATGWLVAQ